MFIKFAEESALVRRPGMPGPVPVFSQLGARLYDKTVEVYGSNRKRGHNGEFTLDMRPPRSDGHDEQQEDKHTSTKHVRTYQAAQ